MASEAIQRNVRAAKNPQEALVALAQGLDALIDSLNHAPAPIGDGWGEWDAEQAAQTHLHNPRSAISGHGVEEGNSAVLPAERRAEIVGDESHTEVILPAVSPERMQARVQFEAQKLKLHEHLGEGDWAYAYAKGGPRWLYYGNRDLANSFPYEVKQAMVMDIELDSPQEAHEIGRDLLKQAGETGPGSPAMNLGGES